MGAWISCTLADIGTIVGGATPSTKDEENYGGNIPWITPKDLSIHEGRFISHGERNITEKGLNSCSAQMLPKNTVLFSSRAPIGYVAIAAQPMCTNQGFKSVVPNEKVDPMFLYYLLLYKRAAIEAMGSGTTFKEVSGGTMRGIAVTIPENINEQKKIANVLSVLDEKIETNAQINANLEQQAMSMFKSWFVDFAPFDRKIPEDWKEYKLGDFLPVITGKKNANVSSESGKYPFFSCSQDIAWTDEYSFDGNAILVAGNGDFNVKFFSGKFEAYQRTYVLIPDNSRYTAWLFYAVKYNLSKITMAARGSVIKFITKGNLENFSFYAPKDLEHCDIIDHFSSINAQIAANREESSTLTNIRNILLSKLMSGNYDIANVEL